MRKQMKIAAIASAAALLAIGASMTSFAATGWQEEDGTWVYYNKNGEQVTSTWEKSGDNWFYLDDDGERAVDSLIEDDDDYYYVNSEGAMVRNQWVAVDNEDAGDDDQPDVWWYYFQSNGKAYRNNHSSNTIFKKVINGKTYCFDEDGKMQYGWVDHDDGTTNYDDDAFESCDYYFGDENDGAMAVGWREIALTDVNDADDDQPGDSYWDEDQVRWFWFKSSGKKQTNKTNKAINGRKYGFDQYGRMIADWYIDEGSQSDTLSNLGRRGAKLSTADNASDSNARDYAEEFYYFSSPEDGARYTKGWFKVVPGYYLNYEKYDDGDSYWYYADGDGNIYAGRIKSIKGKKYAFDLKGGMISGLAVLRVDNTNRIYEYVDDEDLYDTEDNFDDFASEYIDKDLGDGTKYEVYYFGDDEDHDGAMKTGTQRLDLDGDSTTFKFEKSGTKKGQGINGKDDKKWYHGGKLLAADSDDKIEIINTDEKADDYLHEYTVSEFINGDGDWQSPISDGTVKLSTYTLGDGEKRGKAGEDDTTYYIGDDNTKWDLTADADAAKALKTYKVVNTSGSVVKNGTKKDGDEFKVVVKGEKIQQIYVED